MVAANSAFFKSCITNTLFKQKILQKVYWRLWKKVRIKEKHKVIMKWFKRRKNSLCEINCEKQIVNCRSYKFISHCHYYISQVLLFYYVNKFCKYLFLVSLLQFLLFYTEAEMVFIIYCQKLKQVFEHFSVVKRYCNMSLVNVATLLGHLLNLRETDLYIY